MVGSLMRIVSRIINSSDEVVSIGGGSYAIRDDDRIVIAWSRSEAQAILTDGIPNDIMCLDIDPNTHMPGDMTRSSSIDDINDLSASFDGKTILLRFSQFGGHGGMPPGAGMGLGGGSGNTNPMAAPGQFTNYIARQQFDRSLDQVRTGPEVSGWHKNLETRLKDSKLYGHTRKDRDRDMEPYELTWEDRAKLKKERYMDRVREMRRKKAGPPEMDPNSVAAIKSIAPNPDDHIGVEERLGDHRETDGIQFRPGYHGPESQFTHFPRPVKAVDVRGRTIEARSPTGYTTFDDMDGPFEKDPYQHDTTGGDGSDRYHQMPAGMQGYKRENPNNIQELWDHYRNGHPGEYNQDLLMNHWPHGTQPGQDPPVFTEGDKGRIIRLMRQRFYADEQPEGGGHPRGKTTEERLTSRHRSTPTNHVSPTAIDQNADPYPYANDVSMRPPIRKHP